VQINEITERAGAHRRRHRLGRGEASGSGKTCGRGNKGCNARAGGGVRPLTEGGQMPFFRRIAKRGFSNARFRQEFSVVNVGSLEKAFDNGARVTAEALIDAGLVRDRRLPIKVLGTGTLSKKLTVVAQQFSEQARAKITKAGGQTELVAF
jgi:large subunit ribosomal protein L15